MNPIEVPTLACPQCGKVNDRAADAFGEDAPEPGDLSVCIGCAAVLRFKEGMTLELFPAKLVRKLPPQHQLMIARVRAAVKDLHNIIDP